MKSRLLIIIVIVSVGAITSVTIGTIEYQSVYNYNCNSDGGYVTGFLSCTHVNEDFSDPQITGKMAREICSVTGGECPPNYPANVLDDGTKMVGVTMWNAETNSEKSYVFTIVNDTLSYTLNQSAFDLSQITSMRPNSMEFFYYPYPENTENRDVFQKFILIRLPEELGGGADDVSAFRAYSAVSVGVHCLVKYWPDEGRKRLEDPCWGSMYRPIDGAMMYPYPVMNDSPLGLPYLDLSIDENGSLYVEPPVWTMNENGVVGVGRHLSLQEIHQGSQILIDSYEKTNPNHPSIPVSFAGIVLAEINSDHNRVNAKYSDFGSQYLQDISFEIRNVSAQDQQSFLNLTKFNSEYWQIGDTVIRIGGSALDANSKQPEKFRNYDVEFILDGFTYTITGSNLELLKKSIVSTYFPEHSYDDLIFVSSTVKK